MAELLDDIEPSDVVGPHRLYFGDCMRTLPYLADGQFSCVLTDPPYGMSFQSNQRTKVEKFEEIANDDQPYIWWLRDAYRLTKDGGCLVCFCRWDSAEAFRLAIGWAGYEVRAQLIWDREAHGMGDLSGAPSPRHDTIWFAAKGKYKLPGGDRKRPMSVYRAKRLSGSELEHPNQKPHGLMVQLLRDYVPPGGTVLEPFLGSGTTAVACATAGCVVAGCEISREYYQLARRRLRDAADEAKTQLM